MAADSTGAESVTSGVVPWVGCSPDGLALLAAESDHPAGEDASIFEASATSGRDRLPIGTVRGSARRGHDRDRRGGVRDVLPRQLAQTRHLRGRCQTRLASVQRAVEAVAEVVEAQVAAFG